MEADNKDELDENGMDVLWLTEMIGNIPEEYREVLSHFIRVDFESMCVRSRATEDEESIPATDMDIEECFTKDSKDEPWGGVVKIEFNPFGYYTNEEMKKRIAKLKSSPLK